MGIDLSKIDAQWLVGQGIAVFLCVALFGLVMLMMRVIVRELKSLQLGVQEASRVHILEIGKLIGAIRWLGETVRKAMNIAPPKSPNEGFGVSERRTRGNANAPGHRATTSSPTPTPAPLSPEDLEAFMSGDESTEDPKE